MVGELSAPLELRRLLAARAFRTPPVAEHPRTVLLVPGFLAGDASLATLSGWLRRAGHRTYRAGIVWNADCTGASVDRLEARAEAVARRARDGRIALVGQSRGGVFARALAARRPDLVERLVLLGAPVADPLAVHPNVLALVRGVARAGDAGVPGCFRTSCGAAACCAAATSDLDRPLDRTVRTTAICSYRDGVVDWQACLEPAARTVFVDVSHVGMAADLPTYEAIAEALR